MHVNGVWAGGSAGRIWEEDLVIPTYRAGRPLPYPLFLERRVYQGSSGRVYPYPVIDRVAGTPVDDTHRVVWLENEYLRVMVMPAFGGRIQCAYDKTNGYPFIYHNRVIKPALVGLAGPWLSGGIEFNWPQHHRPGTFCPVPYRMATCGDGSVTLWIGETEPMWHLRSVLAITLQPGRAVLTITAHLSNPTPLPRTFHLWTNPAVHVNDRYQSVFPPDVQAVYDHGKRDVSSFPIARGHYYKVDYTRGIDISWYRNLPVPTSYMAAGSRYDFLGGYDHGRQAGMLHVADHHVVPGKKQWVWGCGEFGRAWDRELTDDDGPYAELMCGVFADNQPDFAWLAPYEQKIVTQSFVPYKAIGYVRNATVHAAISLDVDGDRARVGAYATSPRRGALVRLLHGDRVAWRTRSDLGPDAPLVSTVALPASIRPQDLRLEVIDRDGEGLVAYTPEEKHPPALPQPARAIPAPRNIPTVDALRLAAAHLEQYRHATRRPDAYHREALARDPEDTSANLALGRLLLERGCLDDAEHHLGAALQSMTRHNANPASGEAHYLLGLVRRAGGDSDEADALHAKAAWDPRWQDAACFERACIVASRRRYSEALTLVDDALTRNTRHVNAQHLRVAVLRQLGRIDEALALAGDLLVRDPLDPGALAERVLLARDTHHRERGKHAGTEVPAVRSALASRSRRSTLLSASRRSASGAVLRPRSENRQWRSGSAGHVGVAEREAEQTWLQLTNRDASVHLDIAARYAAYGMFEDAIDLLARVIAAPDPLESRAAGHEGPAGLPNLRPLLYYAAGHYAARAGRSPAAAAWRARGSRAPRERCFPNTAEHHAILQSALEANPADASAAYYLGLLWYDRREPERARACWTRARRLERGDAATHRNLAILAFNTDRDRARALRSMRRAFQLSPADARLLFELDLLEKRCAVSPGSRLRRLQRFAALTASRDDLSIEMVTLLNAAGRHAAALDLLRSRRFHPWEGGEGKVTAQHRIALGRLARQALAGGRPEEAIALLEESRTSPPNLGEGRLHGSLENETLYWLGVAHDRAGHRAEARACWREAAAGMDRPAPALYYNDQDPATMVYQGLALQALGRGAAARTRFETLVRFGTTHLHEPVDIDFFAVSLPEFQVFDDDLARRNGVNCRFLRALGWWGLRSRRRALRELDRVLALDPAHQGARLLRRWGP